jgi:hypothetical protein
VAVTKEQAYNASLLITIVKSFSVQLNSCCETLYGRDRLSLLISLSVCQFHSSLTFVDKAGVETSTHSLAFKYQTRV